VITGRAAEIMASLAMVEAAINSTPVGKAVIHFPVGQAHLELRHSFPPVRFDPQLRLHTRETAKNTYPLHGFPDVASSCPAPG
jgi:hypothetical protein